MAQQACCPGVRESKFLLAKEDVALLLRQAPDGTRFIFNSCGMDDPAEGRAWLDAVRAAAAAARNKQA